MSKPTPKKFYCENCKHYCETYQKRKNFLPERTFCYRDGRKTSRKSLACENFVEVSR